MPFVKKISLVAETKIYMCCSNCGVQLDEIASTNLVPLTYESNRDFEPAIISIYQNVEPNINYLCNNCRTTYIQHE